MRLSPSTATPDRAAQMRDASVRPEAPLGRSGKPLVGGRVAGFEHNVRLQGPQKLMAAYRKAERNPAVAAGWSCMRSFMLSAEWDVEAAEDSDVAQRAAAHVRANLGIGRTKSATGKAWERLLSEFLAVRNRGFGWWELVCRQGADGQWYTHCLWRDPASVSAWFVDEWECLVGICQSAGWLTGSAEIPMSRVLYMAREAEGTNFEGVGLLRSAEPLARDHDRTMQALMVAVQRWAIGTPDLVMNRERWRQTHPGGTDQQYESEVSDWKRWLAKYASFEHGYIVREDHVTLGTFGGSGQNSYEFANTLNLQARLILTAYLAQFLALGSEGSGGSYSLGETHAETAQQAGENELEAVRDDLTTSLIPRMVRWGLGADVPDEALPRLTFSGLRAPLWVSLIDRLPAAFSALGITPQTALETEVLRELGFKAEAIDRSPADRLRGTAGRPPIAPPPGPVAIRGTP
jgi:hypothetical protein